MNFTTRLPRLQVLLHALPHPRWHPPMPLQLHVISSLPHRARQAHVVRWGAAGRVEQRAQTQTPEGRSCERLRVAKKGTRPRLPRLPFAFCPEPYSASPRVTSEPRRAPEIHHRCVVGAVCQLVRRKLVVCIVNLRPFKRSPRPGILYLGALRPSLPHVGSRVSFRQGWTGLPRCASP